MTKEEEILRAAKEEFFNCGYDACSTAVIAKRAGVTHAMVNYYFRSKEKLFIQILDSQVYDIIHSLKPVMQAEGNFIRIVCDAALVIFDKINENKRFPYLISDISRTHPDFLLRYKEVFETVCRDSVRMHALRLEELIAKGEVAECTMPEIYHTVLTLTMAPFLTIPFMEKVVGFSQEQVDAYLQSRRDEMVRIIEARLLRTRAGSPCS